MDSERPKAIVRINPGEDNVTISLTIAGKERNLNRPLTEPLEKPLARIKANLAAPKLTKKKGPKRSHAEAADAPAESPRSTDVVLYSDPSASTGELDPSSSNGEAWRLGKVLKVGDLLYNVEYNPPTVSKLSLPRLVMAGFPIYPTVVVQFAEEELCQWRWLRGKPKAVRGQHDWEDAGCSSRRYVATPQDVGCLLRIECTPAITTAVNSKRDEDGLWKGEVAVADAGPVTEVGVATAAEIRQPQPAAPTQSPNVRILSYNILADQYAGMTYSQQVLFNYCPKQYLEPEYRRLLVLQELEQYCADVVCMQEVDEKAFTDVFLPNLKSLGYDGRFTCKMGQVKEGSATFFRTSRFKMVASKDILLRESFKEPLSPIHARFQPLLDASPNLVFALQQVTTIGQATLLLPTDGAASQEGALLVVNTHLFFHPYAPHIRTMHTAAILEEAHHFLSSCLEDAEVAAALGGRRATLVFCGDLNSDLNDGIPGVIELLQSGQLPADFWDWKQGAPFSWGDKGGGAEGEGEVEAAAGESVSSSPQTTATPASGAEPAPAPSPSTAMHGQDADFSPQAAEPSSSIRVTGVDLKIPVKLRAADDLKTPYSNYTSGYKALLDYVWYDPQYMEVVGEVPVPAKEHLATFIPSRVFPSDHLPVIFDLRWK